MGGGGGDFTDICRCDPYCPLPLFNAVDCCPSRRFNSDLNRYYSTPATQIPFDDFNFTNNNCSPWIPRNYFNPKNYFDPKNYFGPFPCPQFDPTINAYVLDMMSSFDKQMNNSQAVEEHPLGSTFFSDFKEHMKNSHQEMARRRILHPTTGVVVDKCLGFTHALGLPNLQKNSNFVFSPLSLRLGLSLAAAGSEAETLHQFLSFLGSSTRQGVGDAAARLLNNFHHATADGRPSFVNGIWVDRSTSLLPSFQRTATSTYKAVADTVDFRNNAQQATRQVNAWIEQSTNGLVSNLIPPQAADSDTKLILANGLFFKGLWAKEFDRSKTMTDVFRLSHGRRQREINVPFMTMDDEMHFLAYFDDGLKVLRLPYLKQLDGPSLSMLLYLPNIERDGLTNLIERAVWDPTFFEQHYPHERVKVRRVKVPKFKISSRFDGSDYLKSAGLTLPFSRSEANFQQMSSIPLSNDRLHIASVHHGACIEVEEKGTTASAATALIFNCYVSSGTPPPCSLLEFVADHPFLFAIRDDDTGAMLFLGHVADPSVE